MTAFCKVFAGARRSGGWLGLGLLLMMLSRPLPAASVPPATEFWSLRPLVRPSLPTVAGTSVSPQHPIDSFLRAQLIAKGLSPSAQADRPTLIRRLSFDLLGLPPTADELEFFVSDTAPDAYERLVDRLLASPRYGERWARHWLDVVHFGETHGYDKDKPRPNAWPYRDYVIRSFNEDKPYARFVQEQVAGDVIFPFTRDGIEALGFIAAGPWDFIGHEEVPETKIDGRVARHLDRDDMVVNTLQTFNSLTIQCAQCHYHKFDPISQEDYYSLQAVFAAVDRTNKKYDIDPAVAKHRAELEDRRRLLVARRQALNDGIAARAGDPLKEIDQKITVAETAGKNSDAFGYHSNIEKKQAVAKWVQVDLGEPFAIANVVLHPARDDFNGIGDGFGFPVRYKVEISTDADFRQTVRVLGDFTEKDVPNPKLAALSVDGAGREARYLRVTVTKLAPRQEDYIFALAELEVLTLNGKNVARGKPVTALDSIEAPARWQRVNLTDGYYPGVSNVESEGIAALRQLRSRLVEEATDPKEKSELSRVDAETSGLKSTLDALPAQSVAYIAAVHTGSGAFVGTGGKGGKPRPVYLLNRGNVQAPGKEMGPGAVESVGGLVSRFEIPADRPEGDRRAALARWLTDPRNPLTWRSIVNRVWQYHFGRGIVETPNDFGKMGSPPTHPELLDWLAVEFRDGGQSLKNLHKLIVTSSAYRQTADPSPELLQKSLPIDGDNRYLWRMNRRKLEAEAIRDSILSISGQLDLSMGGPSFQDFVVEKPEHSPHYEYQLHDPEDPKSHRRSIYRFIVRSQQQPFMTTLDCADPSMQVGRRNESVSPLQALTLLNNALVLSMARHFAEKLEHSGGALEEQVTRGYTQAIGHSPSRADREAMVAYAREQGLPNLCRLLFNLNEFTFVD